MGFNFGIETRGASANASAGADPELETILPRMTTAPGQWESPTTTLGRDGHLAGKTLVCLFVK
jgi:hypothetical protein